MSTESSRKFECDLENLPHRPSNLRVSNPIVSFDSLTDNQREDLLAKMNELTKRINSEFQKLLNQIFESFKKRISCDSLALTLLANNICDEENLDGETSMFRLFKMMHPYCSYFNYELLHNIVTVHGSPQDQKNMQRYIDSFAEYCKAMPCTEEVCGNDITQDTLKLKFKLDFDREQLKPDAVQKIKWDIARRLDIRPCSLHLSRIKDGCVLLEFLIPSFLFDHIFPLWDEYALYTQLKVISIECEDRALSVVSTVSGI